MPIVLVNLRRLSRQHLGARKTVTKAATLDLLLFVVLPEVVYFGSSEAAPKPQLIKLTISSSSYSSI